MVGRPAQRRPVRPEPSRSRRGRSHRSRTCTGPFEMTAVVRESTQLRPISASARVARAESATIAGVSSARRPGAIPNVSSFIDPPAQTRWRASFGASLPRPCGRPRPPELDTGNTREASLPLAARLAHGSAVTSRIKTARTEHGGAPAAWVGPPVTVRALATLGGAATRYGSPRRIRGKRATAPRRRGAGAAGGAGTDGHRRGR